MDTTNLGWMDHAELEWCKARAIRMHEMIAKDGCEPAAAMAFMNDSERAYRETHGAPPKTQGLHLIVSSLYSTHAISPEATT